MYLEIDEGFIGNRKTIRFCGLMQSPEAISYLIRLWTWACRSAPDGDMTGMQPFDVEMLCGYRLLDGKCYAALVEAKFVDVDEDGTQRIHNWGKRTGAAIQKMGAAADRKKRHKVHMERVRGGDQCPGDCEFHKRGEDKPPTATAPRQESDVAATPPRHDGDAVAHTQTRQDKTSPDKTSPVQTSLGTERPPRARARDPVDPKPPNVFKAALAAFCAEWEAHYGETYHPSKAEKSQLGTMLNGLPAELVPQLPAMFRRYLRDPDPFITQAQRHSLLWFCTKGNGVNKYRTTAVVMTAKEAAGVEAGDQWLAMRRGAADAGR